MTGRRSRRRDEAPLGRPPAGERDARLAARRRELLDAAMEAIEVGGTETTMTMMAAEAGVTKPVLYRHFGDRAGLYAALASHFVGELSDALAAALGRDVADPRERVHAAVDAYLSQIERRPQLYRFLARRLPREGTAGQQLVIGAVERIATEVGMLLAERLRDTGVGPRAAMVVGHAVTGMVHHAGDAWLDDRSMPRSEAVELVTSVLWGGIPSLGAPAAES